MGSVLCQSWITWLRTTSSILKTCAEFDSCFEIRTLLSVFQLWGIWETWIIEYTMHEIHLTDIKSINIVVWSFLSHKIACNCTYLYTEDIMNTILLVTYHKIPLHVPFIIFFEQSSRSHSRGLEICIQCCIVLYSYKKNKSTFFAEYDCPWSHYHTQHYRVTRLSKPHYIFYFVCSLLNTEQSQNEKRFSSVFQSSQTGLNPDVNSHLQRAH